MTIIGVGGNSFLAEGVKNIPASKNWVFISHSEALSNPDIFTDARTVVNFAFPPALMKNPYSEDNDFDKALARTIPSRCHYVALSSRMVYGEQSDQNAFNETSPTKPETIYGHNKIKIEQGLQDILPQEKLTILRLSNIFGFEPERHTFFGAALTSLRKDNKIYFDIDPASHRDFLPLSFFAEYLIQIAEQPMQGIFNLGSGVATHCGDIAEWIIEGYGKGEVIINGLKKAGSFVLDMNTTKNNFNLELPTKSDIRQSCLDCGKRLKVWTPD